MEDVKITEILQFEFSSEELEKITYKSSMRDIARLVTYFEILRDMTADENNKGFNLALSQKFSELSKKMRNIANDYNNSYKSLFICAKSCEK